MVNKGILQPDGTVCRSGANCRRHGIKATVAHADAASIVKDQLAEAKLIAQAPQPIIVEKTKFSEPLYDEVTHIIEYDYDSYECSGCYGCDTGEDYCRGAEYSGLELTSVDSSKTLASLLSCSVSDLSPSDIEFAHDVGLDNTNSYDIEGQGGYYGQEVRVTVEGEQMKRIQAWYFKKENANDAHGILAYCRSKGLATQGLSPLEAIKMQLKVENNWMVNPVVERAKSVSVEHVKLSAVKIPQAAHFEKALPRPIKPLTEESKEITGVLVRKNGSFKLVDGYHRLKSAQESKHINLGEFIVLS